MTRVRPSTELDRLRSEAEGCRRCDLYKRATQTVFGEGPVPAALMLVGEAPGDHEDEDGHPFVGPAGHLLDRALVASGIEREAVYLTNAVKHFKWAPKGKVRLHKKPNATEIASCRPWLDSEIAIVAPRIVCCLGATAAQTLLGRDFRVTRQRGQFETLLPGVEATATVHPSAVLRDRDRDAAFAGLVEDLQLVARRLDLA